MSKNDYLLNCLLYWIVCLIELSTLLNCLLNGSLNWNVYWIELFTKLLTELNWLLNCLPNWTVYWIDIVYWTDTVYGIELFTELILCTEWTYVLYSELYCGILGTYCLLLLWQRDLCRFPSLEPLLFTAMMAILYFWFGTKCYTVSHL